MTHAARILLVDDEVAIQRALAPLLRSRGTRCEVVGSGADALERSVAAPADLIVLDLGLPDLEGTEVCRRMREHVDGADHRAVGPRRRSATRWRRSIWAQTTT